MTNFFKNFFVLLVIAGIVTRIFSHFFKKTMSPVKAVNLSSICTLIFTGPIIVIFLGFDIAIAEYAVSLLIWLIIDHMWVDYKKKKEKDESIRK